MIHSYDEQFFSCAIVNKPQHADLDDPSEIDSPPAHLQRARLATIAKDPAFRRYFASADDSATIRKVLVRLFDSQGKRREQLAIEREARSRRSQQASKRRKERLTVSKYVHNWTGRVRVGHG